MDNEVPAVSQEWTHCSYCSSALDPSYTFCLRCAQPYKPAVRILPSKPYMDDEVRIRTFAPQAIQIFLWVLAILVVPGTVASALLGRDNMAIIQLVVQLALIAATIIFACIHSHALVSQLDVRKIFSPYLAIGLLLLPFLLVTNFAYHGIIVGLFGEEVIDPDRFENIFPSLAGMILFFCILPGITEEIVFRGLVQHWLHVALAPAKAILLASALFSLVHFSFLSAPYLLLVGMYLGWLRWKSDSLYPPIIAHTLHNLAVILVVHHID